MYIGQRANALAQTVRQRGIGGTVTQQVFKAIFKLCNARNPLSTRPIKPCGVR